MRKHEQTLKEDKAFCSQVLTALIKMDFPALDAMAARAHDGDNGVRQQVAEVVEIMRTLYPRQVEDDTPECRSMHSGHSNAKPSASPHADTDPHKRASLCTVIGTDPLERASICKTNSMSSISSTECLALPDADESRQVHNVTLEIPSSLIDGYQFPPTKRRASGYSPRDPRSGDAPRRPRRDAHWNVVPSLRNVIPENLLASPAPRSPVLVAQDMHPLGPTTADVPGSIQEDVGLLQKKDVTLLMVNIAGVHAMWADCGPLLAKRLGQATDRVVRAVTRNRGAVVSVHGGIVLAAFNASLRSSMHAFAACNCALGIQGALQGMQPACDVRIGIHTCNLVAGPVRSSRGWELNLLGPGVGLCALLARLNQTLNTSILVTKVCRQAAGHQVLARGVDLVEFTGLGHGHEALEVYELVGERDTSADLSLPPHTLDVRQCSNYDLAWQRFCRGDYAGAGHYVQRHLKSNPDDAWAVRLQWLAKERVKKLKSRPCIRTYGVVSQEL